MRRKQCVSHLLPAVNMVIFLCHSGRSTGEDHRAKPLFKAKLPTKHRGKSREEGKSGMKPIPFLACAFVV